MACGAHNHEKPSSFTHTQQVMERALRKYKHLLHISPSEPWGYLSPPGVLRRILELQIKWMWMDSWLWFWTSDVEWCFIWVPALVLPQQDILPASICTFHHAFLDDQPPLISSMFLCVELLGYSYFFTTLNTGISKLRCRQVRTAAKSAPEASQQTRESHKQTGIT